MSSVHLTMAIALALATARPQVQPTALSITTLNSAPYTGLNAADPVETLPLASPVPPGVDASSFLPFVSAADFAAAKSFDLTARSKELSACAFAEPPAPAGPRTFADLVGAWVQSADHKQFVTDLDSGARIKSPDPRFAAELWPVARELFLDQFVRSSSHWSHLGERTAVPDDGFAFAPPCTLPSGHILWQGAMLIPLARPAPPHPARDVTESLLLYETVQRDLAAYSTNAWNRRLKYSYKGAELLPHSRFITADGKTAYSGVAYTIRIISHHPIHSWIRESITDDGCLQVEYYCPNPPPGMLQYQQGRDTVIPVKDSGGAVVALLVTTAFSCDQQPVQTIRENLGTMSALVAERSGLPPPKIEDERSDPP
jgi:hypothetical protein